MSDQKMVDGHVLRLIERDRLDLLEQHEFEAIQSHIAYCVKCAKAYRAAIVSEELLKTRAEQVVEVPSFFKTRLMAELRQRELSPDPGGFLLWWRSAGVPVSAMIALVLILAAFNFFSAMFISPPDSLIAAEAESIYSPSYIVFDRGEAGDDELVYDQVLATVYDWEESDD